VDRDKDGNTELPWALIFCPD